MKYRLIIEKLMRRLERHHRAHLIWDFARQEPQVIVSEACLHGRPVIGVYALPVNPLDVLADIEAFHVEHNMRAAARDAQWRRFGEHLAQGRAR